MAAHGWQLEIGRHWTTASSEFFTDDDRCSTGWSMARLARWVASTDGRKADELKEAWQVDDPVVDGRRTQSVRDL